VFKTTNAEKFNAIGHGGLVVQVLNGLKTTWLLQLTLNAASVGILAVESMGTSVWGVYSLANALKVRFLKLQCIYVKVRYGIFIQA